MVVGDLSPGRRGDDDQPMHHAVVVYLFPLVPAVLALDRAEATTAAVLADARATALGARYDNA